MQLIVRNHFFNTYLVLWSYQYYQVYMGFPRSPQALTLRSSPFTCSTITGVVGAPHKVFVFHGYFCIIIRITQYLCLHIFTGPLNLFLRYCNLEYLSWGLLYHFIITVLSCTKRFSFIFSLIYINKEPVILKATPLGGRIFDYSFSSPHHHNSSRWRPELVEAVLQEKLQLKLQAAKESLHLLLTFLSLKLLNLLSLKVTLSQASFPSSSHIRRLSNRFSSCLPTM